MSIIYDALKKTQRKRQAIQEPVIKAIPKDNRTLYKVRLSFLLVSTMMLLGLMIIYSSFTVSPPNPVPLPVPAKPKVSAIAKRAEGLVLNGIFISDKSKIAMINNETYKVGDLIKDMKVVDIDLNTVKLSDAENRTFTLKTIV